MHYNRFQYWFLDPDTDMRWQNLHDLSNVPHVVSASVVPSILGVGYDSPNKIYEWSTGIKPHYNKDNIPAIRWGKEKEPVALQQFYQQNSNLLGIKPGFIFHQQFPFLGASSDHICYDIKSKQIFNIEVKCPFNFENVNAAPKLNWLIQIQIQMACLELNHSCLYIWTPEKAMTYHVPIQPEFIDYCIERVKYFLQEHVEKKTPPPRAKMTPEFQLLVNQLQNSIQSVDSVQSIINKIISI